MELALDEIRNTDYVTKASIVELAEANLRMDQNDVYIGSPLDPEDPVFLLQGNAYSLSDDFIANYPKEFEIIQGRYPSNSSEIAITYADAAAWSISLGRMMNYTHTLNGVKRTVFLVGIFKIAHYDPIRYATSEIIALVKSEVLNPLTTRRLTYVDVDRSILSPTNPRHSLNLLDQIEYTIAHINPTNATYFKYFVDNYLAIGMQSYLDSLSLQRSRQISRTQLLLLLSGLLAFLAVRFNTSLREEEMNSFEMRGASKIWIFLKRMRELWILSILSSVLSIILGILFSRIAMGSDGFLEINWQTSTSAPILLTMDMFLIVCLIGFILPIIGYGIDKTFKPITRGEIQHGHLAKIVRNIRLVRWDVTVFLFVILLLLIMLYGGQSVNRNPVLLLLTSLTPIPLLLAVVSIFNKAIFPLIMSLSHVLHRAIGKIPATVGIRSFVAKDSLAMPVIIILSIVLSSCLASNIVSASLPNTHLIQTRYLIGGDLSFHLDNSKSAQWSDFSTAILEQEGTLSLSLVSIGKLLLSEGTQGIVEFVAISPEQYSRVGYDYAGLPLDDSVQNDLLQELEKNREGAILTADIASEYDLIVGDTLRVFSFWEEKMTVEFNIVGITDAIPRPNMAGQISSDSIIGTRKIWLNRYYLASFLELNATAQTYLCVRTLNNANTTKIGNEVLTEYKSVLYLSSEWSSTSLELAAFLSMPNYQIDRAVDNMMTVSFILCMFVSSFTFQVNKQRISKQDNAVLKSLGATDNVILRIRMAEILALILISLLIMTVFGSIDITNIVRIQVLDHSVWQYTFPVSVFVFLNWSDLFHVMFALFMPLIVLIVALSVKSEKSAIASVLNEMECAKNSSVIGESR